MQEPVVCAVYAFKTLEVGNAVRQISQMVVADRYPFQLLQSTDLSRKLTQLVRVQHQNSQIDEFAEVRRHAVEM